MDDRYWMRRALALARKGLGTTSPNPLVGAIVVDKNGKEIGCGYHRRAGEKHAEILALEKAGAKAKGGTLYVTLEPCSHQGRTPPCVDRVIESSVTRVVIATLDPNPVVNGHGAEKLRQREIQVDVGCEEKAATELNAPFRKWVLEKIPFITAKVAISSDGKMGVQGRRVRISGVATETTTMRLRAEAGAILVGAQTAITDDPHLTVRGKYGDRRPIRAVLDSNLRLKPSAMLFRENNAGPVWVFCSDRMKDTPDALALKEAGARVVPLPTEVDGRIDVADVVDYFASNQITSLLVEGGSAVLQQFSEADLIDRWVIYSTPLRLGSVLEGRSTISLTGMGPFPLKIQSVIRRGADLEIWAGRTKKDIKSKV